MTQKLYKMFKEKYSQKWNSFSIYGADERICLTLRDRIFIDKSNLIKLSELEEISKKYFNGFYEIRDGKLMQLRGIVLILNPNQKFEKKEYNNHSFWLSTFPNLPLDMEISTGNRGEFLLTKNQREKYFNFVKDIFNKYKENALKA